MFDIAVTMVDWVCLFVRTEGFACPVHNFFVNSPLEIVTKMT